MAERPTVTSRSEKSAEVVVAGASRRGRRARRRTEREGQSRDMSLGAALHQKPGQPGRMVTGRGEAAPEAVSDEAAPARHAQTDCGVDDLLGQALTRESLVQAWKRVKANKGIAGVDGRSVQDTGDYLKQAWPDIRKGLLDGSYRPDPVRRVGIPKPGGGVRELGIPTVVDRLIQQALLQVLQPLIDPTFSEHSHGFRPRRSAHGAVLEAQQYVQAGYRTVVDVDLEKFFDRVNHDILMDRMAKRIADKRVLRLIRRYLQAGILGHGVHSERFEGTPQGGPLSPLLANVLLDEVDRELERRGHRFVRYADDCNVYVRSRKAGERVLRALRGCYARLALKAQRVQDRGGRGLGTQVPGLLPVCHLSGRSQKSGGRSGHAQAARAHPAADPAHDGAQPRPDRGGLAGLRAGLEGVLPAGADPEGHARVGRMAATPAAGGTAQAVAAWDHDVPRVAQAGGDPGLGCAHRWPRQKLVGQQCYGPQPRAAHRLLRPSGSPEILLTSTSRTARCGPACRVVWEGSGQR